MKLTGKIVCDPFSKENGKQAFEDKKFSSKFCNKLRNERKPRAGFLDYGVHPFEKKLDVRKIWERDENFSILEKRKY